MEGKEVNILLSFEDKCDLCLPGISPGLGGLPAVPTPTPTPTPEKQQCKCDNCRLQQTQKPPLVVYGSILWPDVSFNELSKTKHGLRSKNSMLSNQSKHQNWLTSRLLDSSCS